MNKLLLNEVLLIVFLLNINNIFSKNLLCPNNLLINIGLKSLKDISLVSTNDNKFISKLSNEEREKYEEMIDSKRAFSASMDKVYKSFSPEREGYWNGLNSVTLLFFYISLVIIVAIIFYLLLRFLFKKCKGPKNATDITRCYRNTSWVLMGISTVTVIVLFSIILSYSVKINKDVKKTFDRASDLINNNAHLYSKIDETINDFKNYSLPIPEEELMINFKTNMDKYVEKTKVHTDDIKNKDNGRNIAMILLYVYYLIVIILSLIFFFLKLKVLEGALFFLLLFTLPAMLVFAGYNYKFFFFYADLCGAVNGAIYRNEYPVTGQSLGYYYNCFDRQTKAELYGIRFTLYNSAISSINYHEEAMNKYNTLNNKVLASQLNCDLVREIVPKIENDFCKDNLTRMNKVIQIMLWLILFTFFLAISVRLLENLIWKKKAEIESMIENLEQIY